MPLHIIQKKEQNTNKHALLNKVSLITIRKILNKELDLFENLREEYIV